MDGRTRWKASSAEPPCAAGSVSGPTVSSNSITEPGQPCVMISGNAPSCRDLTWMKWMSTPSITVLHCWSAFSFASHLRQSYSAAQYRASSWIVASCTPCDRSATSSLLGKRVAAMRRRRSAIGSSGMSTRKGRISVSLAITLHLAGVVGTASRSRIRRTRRARDNPGLHPGSAADRPCLADGAVGDGYLADGSGYAGGDVGVEYRGDDVVGAEFVGQDDVG